jgi:hypothetical protein
MKTTLVVRLSRHFQRFYNQKNPPGPSWPKRVLYAPGRIRTCGLSLRRRALYPLSYGRLLRTDRSDHR